jgi:hypothetical protein
LHGSTLKQISVVKERRGEEEKRRMGDVNRGTP